MTGRLACALVMLALAGCVGEPPASGPVGEGKFGAGVHAEDITGG